MNIEKINISNSIYTNQKHNISKSTFRGKEDLAKAGLTGLSAVAASAVAAMNMNNTSDSTIKESDINFGITLCGAGNIRGNCVDVDDYRAYLPNDFSLPVMRKVKIQGKTNTIVMFRLAPETQGSREGDNMTMQLNCDISAETVSKLINKLEEVGVITHKKYPAGNTNYFVNSTEPREFMAIPKIKTIIANFLNERSGNVMQTQKVPTKPHVSYNLKLSDINMVELNRVQDNDNQREVKDYLRDFLNNGKNFTVVHDKIIENNQTKEITALLIPVTHAWDCFTVTIDRNIPDEKCKGLLDYMARAQITETEDPRFKSAILEYFNS